MTIFRIGGARFSIGFDRLAVLVELLINFSKRKPSRREIRLQFQSLRHQVRRALQIAAHSQVATEIIAPVGDQIA